MLRIIWIIIDESHCADSVETFHKHSLRVEISKSERTDYLCHAASLSELFNCIQESC